MTNIKTRKISQDTLKQHKYMRGMYCTVKDIWGEPTPNSDCGEYDVHVSLEDPTADEAYFSPSTTAGPGYDYKASIFSDIGRQILDMQIGKTYVVETKPVGNRFNCRYEWIKIHPYWDGILTLDYLHERLLKLEEPSLK
jgi:hypothetical protein